MPTTTSGFFLQRVINVGGDAVGGHAGAALDLIVPVPAAPFGLAHYRRGGDDAAWRLVATFAEGLGAVAAASLIQSNFGDPGNLELVARIGDTLAAFWCAPTPEPSWSGPQVFAAGAAGNPALIQASSGQRGDFELVVPRADGGVAHYRRDNDSAGLPWHGPSVFGEGAGRVDAVAMIQSNYGSPGHLEVVARIGDRLVFFWRASGPDRAWHGPHDVVAGVAGAPALLQGSGGRRGNFELVAPLAAVGLGHWVRDNDAPGSPWRGPEIFATGLGRCEAVSLLQGGDGAPGRLELAVQAGGQLLHLARDGQAWSRRATVAAALRPPQPIPTSATPPPSAVVPRRPAGPPPRLRTGPHRAGFRRIADLALSPDARYPSTWAFEGAIYRAPERAAALLYYPAPTDGEEAPLSPGGPFPVIALAHERRLRASEVSPDARAPVDLDQDYRQLSGVMAHLARWGFVVIAPDLSWLTPDDGPARRAAVLGDALTHLRAGSKGPLLADFDHIGLLGHGLGALAALALATDGARPFHVRALALLAPVLAEGAAPPAAVAPAAPAPILILHGAAGADAAPAASLYARAAAPKHLVTIAGADRFGYTTSLALAEPHDARAALSRREQQAVAMGYLSAFFNHALRRARDDADAGALAGRAPLHGLERLDVAVRAELP